MKETKSVTTTETIIHTSEVNHVCKFYPSTIPFNESFRCECKKTIKIEYGERMKRWISVLSEIRDAGGIDSEDEDLRRATDLLIMICLNTPKSKEDRDKYNLLPYGVRQETRGYIGDKPDFFKT